jgi:uncharacterized membrane protein YqaE (UPF0057 family)/cell division protein ZapA (FtsZ GTPase activity inhibitor)
MKKVLLLSVSAMFLIASCTVEKRLYRNGFNVQWQAMNGISKKDKNVEVETPADEMLVAKTILAPKTIVKTTEAYVAPVQESNSVEQTLDVASVSVAPVSAELNQVTAKVTGIAAQTISNQHKNHQAVKKAKQEVKALKKEMKQEKSDDVPVGLLYVLCFFIPFVAVGLATDWDITTVLINILWTMLCGIPGIIHAFIIVGRNT